jgi:hypothetical protein
VLLITVNASSSNDAVKRASALAAAFLRYRANQLEAQQKLRSEGLTSRSPRQAGSRRSASRSARCPLSPRQAAQRAPHHPGGRARRGDERARSARANCQHRQGEHPDGQPSHRPTGSQGRSTVRGAPHPPVVCPLRCFGLIAGPVLGLGIVVVRAVSDRLYRRDDVARCARRPGQAQCSHRPPQPLAGRAGGSRPPRTPTSGGSRVLWAARLAATAARGAWAVVPWMTHK